MSSNICKQKKHIPKLIPLTSDATHVLKDHNSKNV